MPSSLPKNYRNVFEKLSNKAKYFDKYSLLFAFGAISLGFAFLIFLVGGKKIFDISDAFHIIFSMLLAIIWILFIHKMDKKLGPYKLSGEERVYLYAYQAHQELRNYLDTNLINYKKKAITYLSQLSGEIDKWEIGNLKSVWKLVGKEVNTLKQIFDRKVLLTVKKGENEKLKNIAKLLFQFIAITGDENISVDGLKRLAGGLEKLEEIPVEEKKGLSRLKKTISEHTVTRYLIVSIGSFSISLIVYIIGDYIDIDKNYLFTITVSVFFIVFFKFHRK